ncbi:MAG: sortase [Acidimicrobiia bacterium]
MLVRGLVALGLVVAFVVAGPADATSREDTATPGSSRAPVFHPTQSNGREMGTVRIPAIGVDETIRSGVDIDVINQGVAHWVGTADAGGEGNMVLAGHRTTYTKPFYDLGELSVGDLVYVSDDRDGEVMYRVTESFIVDPEDIWITFDQESPMLTMFACHPKGSTRYRIVVTAEPVADVPIA